MKLNTLEYIMMNNPIRAYVQDHYEARQLRELSDLPEGRSILEIGCGNGTGTKLIQKYFKPSAVCGIDLDPRMIQKAKKKNPHVPYHIGDAADLPYDDEQFDAVINFGIIHHIPNWYDCLDSVYRVLRPGGQFILEDFSLDSFENFFGKVMKVTLDHPYESMYTQKEFCEYLTHIGFSIDKQINATHLGFDHFMLVAKKQPAYTPVPCM